jgi:hypothetical protein
MENSPLRRLEKVSLVDEAVEMSARTGIYGADRSSLTRCEILLLPKGLPAGRSGGRFEIGFAKLDHCTLRARATIQNLRLTVRTQLLDCRFEGGPFVKTVIGHGGPPVAPLDGWPDNTVQRCDFRNAELRDTRFYAVPYAQVQLPGWPHIALLGKHAGVTGAEPQVFGRSTSPSQDPLRFALNLIRDKLERSSPEDTSIYVVQVRELLPDPQYDSQLREMLDKLAHPRIRY